MWTQEHLEKLSTQRLLEIYKLHRKECMTSIYYYDGEWDEDEGEDPCVIKDRIKAILDTREHVPKKPKKKKPRSKSQRGKKR